ncbi:MAG: sugar phosphate isomerase/epimerase family protein [Thermoproteota archaeon]
MKIHLAAFPKCFMDELCVKRSMTIFDWISMARTLDVEGIELYNGFFESFDEDYLRRVREAIEGAGLKAPMFCYSPDFTNPDPARRRREIEAEIKVMRVASFFGARTCRVLSGQRYPSVSREEGVRWVVAAIRSLLPHAEELGLVLAMENHYKDNYWTYPEFAQKSDVFLEIIGQIESKWFGINYDPSNALIAGEDPINLLEAVKHRLVSMHASDRYLEGGTIEDLRKMEDSVGYAKILKHGVVGKGMIDYDKIFEILRSVDFEGWISIEDGLNGLEEIRDSASFLRRKIKEYGG